MTGRRRGMLIPVLFLITFMLVLCLAELGRQPDEYRAAQSAALSAQARTLAESGMEDFRLKWTHDYDFPPEYPEGSDLFTYMEEVRDFQTNQVIGYYRISVQGAWRWAPYEVLKVTSEGVVGASDNPTCIFGIQGLFDIKPENRTGAGANPNLGRWIEWRECAL